MNAQSPIRRCCAVCGSREEVEEHHLGGRQHAPYFTIPLCRKHHEAVTVALRLAGVEMRNASDREERLRRARLAGLVFLWFVEDSIKENHP